MGNVLYICDRKRCNPCDNELCGYTTDIDHAVNFQKDREGNYWECIGVMLEKEGNNARILTGSEE